MAIAFVQETGHGTYSSPGLTAAVTVTNAPGAGNLLILSGMSGGNTITSVTDSKGNTWRVDKTGGNSTVGVPSVASTVQDVGTLTGTDTITIHWQASISGTAAAAVHEFSGATNTVDQTASNLNATAGTARDAGTTAATTNANDLVWAAWAIKAKETSLAAGTGYTTPTTAFYASGTTASIEFEYQIVSATGAQHPTATAGKSAAYGGVTVVYKAAAAGPVNNTLTASPGAMAITGAATTLPTGRKLSMSAGSMAITGAATTLPTGRKLALSPGSIVINGFAATLTGPGGIAYTLVASAGSFAITGSAATLPTGRKLSISPASYAITGSPTTQKVARALVTSPGVYTISGANATLVGPGAPPATAPPDVQLIPLAIVTHSI